MKPKNFWVVAIVIIATTLLAHQAKAFYLTVPDRLLANWQSLQRQQVLGETITNTDAAANQTYFPPCPSGQVYLCAGNTNPGPNMTCPSGQPTCGVLDNNQNQTNQLNQNVQQPLPPQNNNSQPFQQNNFNQLNQTLPLNNLNSTNQTYNQYNQMMSPNGPMQNQGNFQNSQYNQVAGQDGQMMNQNQNNQQPGEMMKPNNQGFTRDIAQMEQNLTRAAKIIGNSDKITQARALIADLKASLTGDQANFDNDKMDQLRQLTNDLQDDMQNAQHLTDMKRQTGQAAKGLANFEKQLAKLTKQKIAIPADVTNAITAAHNAINAINKATAWDDNLPYDMQEAMQNLNEQSQTLNMLSRWPQTVKDLTQIQKTLTAELKKTASITTKLKAKGVDVSDLNNSFIEAANKIKEAAAQAKTLISSDPQSAFDTLNDDVYSQLDDTQQLYNNLNTISNLGTFTAQFNRNVSQIQNRLKLKVIKASDNFDDLQTSLQDFKDAGAKIKTLIAAKPLDVDTVSMEIENLGGLYVDLVSQLDDIQGINTNFQGMNTATPWENAPQQFSAPSVNFQQFINKGPQNNNGGGQMMNDGAGGFNQNFNNQPGNFNQGQQMAPGTF